MEFTSENSACDGGTCKSISHFVGTRFDITHGSDAEVVAQTMITVTVVDTLDEFNELFVVLFKLWERYQFGIASDLIFWDWAKVIESFAFSSNSWFHCLEDCVD